MCSNKSARRTSLLRCMGGATGTGSSCNRILSSWEGNVQPSEPRRAGRRKAKTDGAFQRWLEGPVCLLSGSCLFLLELGAQLFELMNDAVDAGLQVARRSSRAAGTARAGEASLALAALAGGGT